MFLLRFKTVAYITFANEHKTTETVKCFLNEKKN